MEDQYLNKWLYFPWLKSNNMDYLIHDDDVKWINGLGVVKCLGIAEDFLTVRNKNEEVRVRREGVKKILPDPKFTWGDEVCEIDQANNKAAIADLFWHHQKEEFLYFLEVQGKQKSKQFEEKNLLKLKI